MEPLITAPPNTLYIQKIKIVRDAAYASGYSDMVKVNQFSYLPNQRKLAFVSYETGTVSPTPTYFQVKDANIIRQETS